MWTAVWSSWPEPERPAQPQKASATELLLARARHPSFSSAVAAELVRTLSRRELAHAWAETCAELEQPLPDRTRFHLVLLREQLLDRAEELGPRPFRRSAIRQLRRHRRPAG
ncbi:MAG TPA: hypothetical protein PLZ93_21435 [Nocardioides sp.]|nr:hypothetical protein [Nocardioides sp.]HRI98200.1 hypothetical protein [Nocardioides sp.]